MNAKIIVVRKDEQDKYTERETATATLVIEEQQEGVFNAIKNTYGELPHGLEIFGVIGLIGEHLSFAMKL